MSPDNSPDASRFPLELADQCVKCGLCLPHCPTYALTGIEADAPRGRISLMQGLVTDSLELSPTLESHLDRCLGCRACEAACPSKVPFGALMDAAQGELRQRGRKPSFFQRLLMRAVASRALMRATPFLLYLYRRLGLRRLVTRLTNENHGLGRANALLSAPEYHRRPRTRNSAGADTRGTVGLFLGCVAPATDGRTAEDSVYVLNKLGYDVVVPKSQTCCGALHQHAGDSESARGLMLRNLRAFRDAGVDTVLVSATGCAATLVEYDRLLGNDPEIVAPARAFVAGVRDITSFVADRLEESTVRLTWPPNSVSTSATGGQRLTRVNVHVPCTARNVLKNGDDTFRLIAAIDGLQPVPLSGNDTCCGAAGAYMLMQPELSRRLGAEKHRALDESGESLTVTGNIGCAMVLGARRNTGNDTHRVLHPITLVAQAMAPATDK